MLTQKKGKDTENLKKVLVFQLLLAVIVGANDLALFPRKILKSPIMAAILSYLVLYEKQHFSSVKIIIIAKM